MMVIEARGGRIVIQHPDGYTFTFQVHDVDELVMNLEEVAWPIAGAPPDADDLEMQARRVAEQEAQAQGWM